MKGVILAGGRGTRLRPLTRVVNKHILPVYDKPMIYYPVQTLIDAGIDEILVISNADHIGKYMELLELDFDANFSYQVQSEPRGIAHGVALAEEFVDGEPFAVMLGDNILLDDGFEAIQRFEETNDGAKIFLTRVDEPAAYGIAWIDGDEVARIEEKPAHPDSDYAVVGLYLYRPDVFERIERLNPSDRGEYEITDVNRQYVEEGSLGFATIEGEWFDAGTPEGLFQAAQAVRDRTR